MLKIYWPLQWVKNSEMTVFASALCARRSSVAPLTPAWGHPGDSPQPSHQPGHAFPLVTLWERDPVSGGGILTTGTHGSVGDPHPSSDSR